MHMTDNEIRESWDRALDKHDHVQILADRNCITPSEMMQHLIELGVEGLDKRWYKNNRKEKAEPPNTEPTVKADIGIALTKAEAFDLLCFIKIALVKFIQNDCNPSSMQWLINIVHAYEKLCAFIGEDG